MGLFCIFGKCVCSKGYNWYLRSRECVKSNLCFECQNRNVLVKNDKEVVTSFQYVMVHDNVEFLFFVILCQFVLFVVIQLMFKLI